LASESRESLFKRWVSEHRAIVLKVARAYTRTSDDCQDLAQEILLQLWRSLARFEGRASASTWIYRVALNTALGWQRDERRRRARQKPLIDVEDRSASRLDGSRHADQRELIQELYAAIRQLPKADAALVLLYLDDLSYREMAEVLGLSESNVGVKLNRAKKALSALMREKAHER
jgi:RNA polymerase sigma-70 factor, ECF subfamily